MRGNRYGVVHIEPSETTSQQIAPPRLIKPPVEARRIASSHRVTALRAWLDAQFDVEPTPVTIPGSALDLTIFQPTSESREKLFADARASPEQQLPFWADIWPSGIALGKLVLEHAEFLSGQSVLEIGSGLGTTAAATLSTGAKLVAMDYTPSALGLCRYNALINVGESPRTIAANWRHLTRHAVTRLNAAGPFPIIMAADVLYESRDIEPLIQLIDRLLAPDGQLWLSEPERKVASRFLDTLALRGWRFTTFTSDGPWPNRQTDRINIHFLRRDLQPGRPHSTVGGWRI
ncbi:methyltransferase domain-containing protein [soil metagenome]